MPAPRQCFVSYAHRDHEMFARLCVHLTAVMELLNIRIWHDGGLKGGADWDREVRQAMTSSQVFVVLATNDWFASKYVRGIEIPGMKQQARDANALILPAIGKRCAWKPFFGDYIQAMPLDATNRLLPIQDWPNEDGYAEYADAVHEAVKDHFLITSSSPFHDLRPPLP